MIAGHLGRRAALGDRPSGPVAAQPSARRANGRIADELRAGPPARARGSPRARPRPRAPPPLGTASRSRPPGPTARAASTSTGGCGIRSDDLLPGAPRRPRRSAPRRPPIPGTGGRGGLGRTRGRGRSCSARAPPGCSPAPISPSTRRTASICSSRFGEAASATCTIRSASVTSSSVERNASTRSCGSLLTNPTVSETTARRRPGSSSRRVVGSSVANSWSATITSAPVSRLHQRRLPGVRVAGDRHLRDAGVLPPRALHVARLRERLDVAAELRDPPADVLAVDLHLRLARARGVPDAAARAGSSPRPSRAAAGAGS